MLAFGNWDLDFLNFFFIRVFLFLSFLYVLKVEEEVIEVFLELIEKGEGVFMGFYLRFLLLNRICCRL